MISRLRNLLSARRPNTYAVLDLGSVDAKALVVLVEHQQAFIVGAGRQAHAPGAMHDGVIVDAQAAAACCEQALAQAEALTETVAGEKIIADRAVIGLSGPALRSVYLSVTAPRSRPAERISQNELTSIMQRGARLCLQQGRQGLTGAGQTGAEVALVHAQVVQLQVDGYQVSSPLRLQGRQLEARLSTVFVPVDYLAAVSGVVASLGMEVVGVQANVCAVGRRLERPDSIVIDAGGAHTDILLTRGGGVESIRSLALGGVSFSRHIARALGVPPQAAEDIKKTYAGGRLDARRSGEVRAALAPDIQAWLDGVESLLGEMAGHEPLPPRLFLCGGCAGLRDLEQALRQHPWARRLTFSRYPELVVLQPGFVHGPQDRTHRLMTENFVAPAALAGWAEPGPDTLPQRTLTDVLHRMGVS